MKCQMCEVNEATQVCPDKCGERVCMLCAKDIFKTMNASKKKRYVSIPKFSIYGE